ncbi:hypothetical protein DM01DRAFT_1099613 [Hesseltinella vesiculosa]|uniref:Uncharacterized protein n=1 Tax=Hesseltinella vesiculosa TaxID=101127 RepID=A0A1X2GC25_9FUNG|nr:hypothetical protein DM01DRAFT_1099613 [Hesseltinella vesiculosa]
MTLQDAQLSPFTLPVQAKTSIGIDNKFQATLWSFDAFSAFVSGSKRRKNTISSLRSQFTKALHIIANDNSVPVDQANKVSNTQAGTVLQAGNDIIITSVPVVTDQGKRPNNEEDQKRQTRTKAEPSEQQTDQEANVDDSSVGSQTMSPSVVSENAALPIRRCAVFSTTAMPSKSLFWSLQLQRFTPCIVSVILNCCTTYNN